MQKVFTDIDSNLHTVFLGYEQTCTWQLFLHSAPPDDEPPAQQEIVGHDVITIKHSELEGYLCSSISFQGDSPEIYFRCYKGATAEEEVSVGSADQLNCLWEILHEDRLLQGKPFEANGRQRFVLRHFSSGRLLCIDERSNLVLEKLSNEGGALKPEPLVLSVEPIQKSQHKIFSNQSYKLFVNQDQPLVVSRSLENLTWKTLESNVKTAELEKEMNFTPLDDDFFDESRVVASPHQKAVLKAKSDVEEGYVFAAVDTSLRQDMQFVRSAMVELTKLARIYKYNHQSAANAQRLVEVEVLLTNILCFIFDLEYTPDFDFRSIGKGAEPRRLRQKVLKDLNVLEVLMQMIHYPFKNQLYSEKSVHTLVYAKEIIQLCYSVIRGCIARYRPNELYASQWLNLLIEYSLSGLDDSLGANATLKELIDDNERILDAQIKKGTIDKFVYNLVDSRGDKKYVDILRAVCICNGVPVAKNQRDLAEIILKDNATRKKLIPEHKLEGSEVLIRSPWAKETGADWVTFSNFKSESGRLDKGKYFNYYTSLVYLLGDLCLGRNYVAIDGLQGILPLATCVEAIVSEEYAWSLRSAFCKLTTNLWIDVFPCMPLQFPENIKVWASVEGRLQHKPADEHQAKFTVLKAFVLEFMASVRLDCRALLQAHEGEYAGFLTAVILMSRKMVTLGFFTEDAAFAKIFAALVEILVATDELLAPETEDGQHETAEDERQGLEAVYVDIKIKVCQLLQLFTEVKTDSRATRLLALYKRRVEGKAAEKSGLARNKTMTSAAIPKSTE